MAAWLLGFATAPWKETARRERLVVAVVVVSVLAVVAALVLLVAFPTSQGLQTVREFRRANAQIESELRRVATQVIVIDNPRLLRTPIFSWRLDDEIDWYVLYGDVPGVLSALAGAGIDDVIILPDPTRDTLQIAPYSTGEKVDAPVLESQGIPVFLLSGPVSSAIET